MGKIYNPRKLLGRILAECIQTEINFEMKDTRLLLCIMLHVLSVYNAITL